MYKPTKNFDTFCHTNFKLTQLLHCNTGYMMFNCFDYQGVATPPFPDFFSVLGSAPYFPRTSDRNNPSPHPPHNRPQQPSQTPSPPHLTIPTISPLCFLVSRMYIRRNGSPLIVSPALPCWTNCGPERNIFVVGQ